MVENLTQLSLDETTEFRNFENQLKWHQHRGVTISYHCHICLQEGLMEENH